jgi:hypothetical protein
MLSSCLLPWDSAAVSLLCIVLNVLIPLQPSDRLKSEEELAREEKERLEKLEMERLQRMHGLKEDFVPERKHRSADDLDDGFVYNILTFVLVRTVIFSLLVGT